LTRKKGINIDDVFQMKVFPNPAHGETTVSIKNDQNALVKLFVKDVTGKDMLNMKFITITKGEAIYIVD
jgi:hypothetical protein